MDPLTLAMLGGSTLLLFSVVASKTSFKIGVPTLIIFLAIGMLVGEDGLGIEFDDYSLAQTLGTLALNFILFSGGLDTNISVPLRGICLLRRGSDNRITQVTAEDCYDELLHYCFAPEDDTLREKANMLVKELVRSIPLWRLECNKEPHAALVSYQAMHG